MNKIQIEFPDQSEKIVESGDLLAIHYGAEVNYYIIHILSQSEYLLQLLDSHKKVMYSYTTIFKHSHKKLTLENLKLNLTNEYGFYVEKIEVKTYDLIIKIT